MRARVHILGTDRVVWRPADEAARLVAAGSAEYTDRRAADEPAPEALAPAAKPASKRGRR